VPEPRRNLYTPCTEQQLFEGVFKSCKSPITIRKGIKFLKGTGALSVHKKVEVTGVPEDAWKRKNYYLFHPEVVNQWIDKNCAPEPTPETPKNTPAQKQGALNHHTPYAPKSPDLTHVTQTTTKVTKTKTCPQCGSPMTQRKNKAGQTFWGCTQYPKCDHTETITEKYLTTCCYTV